MKIRFAILFVVVLLIKAQSQQVRIDYSQTDQQRILPYFYEDIQDKLYIDIGSFHPLSFSNTVHLYSNKWRGINVEPSYQRIKNFYQMRNEDINLNVAAGENQIFETFYQGVKPQLSSVSQKVSKIIDLRLSYKVPSLSYQSICLKYFKQKIVFMTLDTEGIGFRILNNSDWKKYPNCRPELIMCQDNKVGTVAGFPPMKQILILANYTQIDVIKSSGVNRLFVTNQLKQKYEENFRKNKNKFQQQKAIFIHNTAIESQLTRVLGYRFVLGEGYQTVYNTHGWEVFIKIARKDYAVDIKKQRQNSMRLTTNQTLKNRPIVIFELDPKRSPIILQTNQYTVSKTIRVGNSEFYNITVSPPGQKVYNVYVFDHRYPNAQLQILAKEEKNKQTNNQSQNKLLLSQVDKLLKKIDQVLQIQKSQMQILMIQKQLSQNIDYIKKNLNQIVQTQNLMNIQIIQVQKQYEYIMLKGLGIISFIFIIFLVVYHKIINSKKRSDQKGLTINENEDNSLKTQD